MESDQTARRPRERLRAFQGVRSDAVVTTAEKASGELEQPWRTN